jgi:hypothetical protein
VPGGGSAWTLVPPSGEFTLCALTDKSGLVGALDERSGSDKRASTAYLTHVLDDCAFPPRTIRSTRLVDFVNTMDPKLVAAAFGMDPEATLIYLADQVDPTRLPNP